MATSALSTGNDAMFTRRPLDSWNRKSSLAITAPGRCTPFTVTAQNTDVLKSRKGAGGGYTIQYVNNQSLVQTLGL